MMLCIVENSPTLLKRSNIDKDEEEALKKLAAHLLSLTVPLLSKAQRAGELMEVDCDAQDKVEHS